MSTALLLLLGLLERGAREKKGLLNHPELP